MHTYRTFKTTVLTTLAVTLTFSCFATLFADTKTIAVMPFTTSVKYEKADGYRYQRDDRKEISLETVPDTVYETTTSALGRAVPYTIIDRGKMSTVLREQETQKGERFLDSKHLAKQGKMLGADIVVTGNVDTFDIEANEDTNGKAVSYTCVMSLSLRALDVETGQVLASQRLAISSNPANMSGMFANILSLSKSPADAFRRALDSINKSVLPFAKELKDNLGFGFVLVEFSNADGAAVVNGGRTAGVKAGDELRVIEQVPVEIEGKTLLRKKTVGTLSVTKVEDENFSDCKVTSGGADIEAKRAAKVKLLVIPSDEPPAGKRGKK